MYMHSQPGILMRVLIVGGIAVLLIIGTIILEAATADGILQLPEQNALLSLMGGIFVMAFALLLVHNLTASVDHEGVRISYGIGIINRRIRHQDISQCSPVKDPWWWGIGIRKIPGGWMWNVSGLSAVELKLKNGRVFRIGTDEPDRLAAAIRERLND
ncbi:MAG TPA: hypothetical protein VF398_09685 [bacterium]|jgi:hypothetical protein